MKKEKFKIPCKIIAFSLCLGILLGCFWGRDTILGFKLPDVAALASVTPSDMEPVVPNLIESGLETTAISHPSTATQVKNVLLTVTMERSDINTAELAISATSGVSLLKFSNVDITASQAATMVTTSEYESSGYIYVNILSAFNFAQDTHLLNVYFNAPVTYSSPQNNISCVLTDAVTDDGSSAAGVFSYQRVLLGDIDGDGKIDANDALLTLQHGNGSITLAGTQFLAGDVDMDGKVNATDALAINQYAVEKVLSFLDPYRVNLPEGTATGVASNFVYQIKMHNLTGI